MTRRAALPLALAAALAGCALFPGRQPTPAPAEGEWGDLRTASTRRAELMDGLVHRATATATFLSADARAARARRLGRWQDWPIAEIEAAVAREQADAARVDEFVLALFTPDRRANDLDGTTSIWRVDVERDGVRSDATRVEALDVDATVRQLYGFVGPFDVVYRIRAPRPTGVDQARAPVLRLSSAYGRLELDYGPGGRAAAWPFTAP